MSASLVGSEMCIRDRCPLGVGWQLSAVVCAFALMLLHNSGGYQGNELKAVSYTHLTLPTICSV
eukprot:1668219-Alexandrium_andersonii.AAC.1